MEFKGTPAPWNYNGNVCGAVESPTDDLIACAYPMHYENAEEMKANAHLIAAAPELLEALRELIQTHEYSLRIGYERIIELGGDCDSPEIMITKDSSLNKAKAAIAKALGQQ